MPRELAQNVRGPAGFEREERPAVLGDRLRGLVLEEGKDPSEERGIDAELQGFDGD